MGFNVLKMFIQSIFLDSGEQSYFMVGPFVFLASYYFLSSVFMSSPILLKFANQIPFNLKENDLMVVSAGFS